MAGFRKQLLALATAATLSCGVAHGLTMGNVSVQSASGQPFAGEIALRDLQQLSATDIAVSLASAEAFSRAGLTRSPSLQRLRFEVDTQADGRGRIRIRSAAPLSVSQLDLLLEVRWPSGRLMRQYALQLERGPRYTTRRNDTLWDIARNTGEGGSIQQVMLAIQDLNPDAFAQGNINRLKTGQALRLPDATQVRRRSQAQAIAEVEAQNLAWREGRALPARQQDARPEAVERPDAAAKVTPGDNLRLLSADQGQGKDARDATIKELTDRLALAQERLDVSERSNQELESRLDDLQRQLDKLQQLLVLKDEQLAQLEAELAAQPDAPSPALQQARAWFANPLVAGSILLALLLILLTLILFRRKVRKQLPTAAPVASKASFASVAAGVAGGAALAEEKKAEDSDSAFDLSIDGLDEEESARPAEFELEPFETAAPATPFAAASPAAGDAEFDLSLDDQPQVPELGADAIIAEAGEGSAEPRSEQVDTKLEMVHAFIDMEQYGNAREILEEILVEGNESQQREARELLTALPE